MKTIETINKNLTESARELHTTLGISQRFSAWFDTQIKKFDLIEGRHFYKCMSHTVVNNGAKREVLDCLLSVEVASRIAGHSKSSSEETAMVHENFAMQAMNMNQLLDNPEQAILFFSQIATKQAIKIAEKEKLLLEQAPKVEAFEELMNCTNAISMKDLAGVLAIPGIGRTNLFKYLRNKKVLTPSSKPYQEYINRGWFKLKESTWKHPRTGEKKVSISPVVLQAGVDGIRRMLKRDGY